MGRGEPDPVDPDAEGVRAGAGGPLVVVLDVANVMGSRPDGWWRDRAGAAERVLADAGRVLRTGGAAAVLAVLEGRARTAGVPAVPGLDVVLAPGEGDDAIADAAVRSLAALAALAAPAVTSTSAGTSPGAPRVVVVTADRGLRRRLPDAVAAAGPRWWSGLVDAAGAEG